MKADVDLEIQKQVARASIKHTLTLLDGLDVELAKVMKRRDREIECLGRLRNQLVTLEGK